MGCLAWLRKQAGASVVEMALLTPFLLLLLAGAVDFGMAFHHWIVLTNAAREGVREGTRIPCYFGTAQLEVDQRAALKTAIQTAVAEEAQNNGIELDTATQMRIIPDPVNDGCAARGTPLTVVVWFPFQTLLGNISGSPTLTVTGRLQMMAVNMATPMPK